MKFVLKPSLKLMSLIKIAILLWNQDDVRALLSKLNSTNWYSIEKWKTIEESVLEKVRELSLPQILTEKVLGFVKPVGLEIKGWMEFHCTCFNLLVHLPPELFWTPQGIVDRKKTAILLVRDENLDMSTRYRLACIYCLEDDIIKFWNSMPEDLKESVSNEFPIISFWSCNMRRKSGDAHIDYRSEFDQCAFLGYKVAAEYFLQKLNPQEREESLVETAKHVAEAAWYTPNADVLCYQK